MLVAGLSSAFKLYYIYLALFFDIMHLSIILTNCYIKSTTVVFKFVRTATFVNGHNQYFILESYSSLFVCLSKSSQGLDPICKEYVSKRYRTVLEYFHPCPLHHTLG